MSVMDIMKSRRSVRRYKNKPIPEDILNKVLEAARIAPSGKNFQPWKFIIVRDREKREELAVASRNQAFVAQAPVVIAACGFPGKSYQHQGNYMKSWPIDVSIAMDHLMLMAWEEGLGTCWIGAFREDEVKRILSIPDDVRVLALTPLGYPDEEPRDRGRKELSEIISYDKY
ncbi:MAG: nitroreductase family protein [Candidatus Aminicenantes bacterium]|nr:nitroreductase family protein [Candidatus Aminicenantes bacterium]